MSEEELKAEVTLTEDGLVETNYDEGEQAAREPVGSINLLLCAFSTVSYCCPSLSD